ncbi:hypothetical protein PI23P_10832, partial [Polaribacter irgensii 23-P]
GLFYLSFLHPKTAAKYKKKSSSPSVVNVPKKHQNT